MEAKCVALGRGMKTVNQAVIVHLRAVRIALLTAEAVIGVRWTTNECEQDHNNHHEPTASSEETSFSHGSFSRAEEFR